MPAGGGAHDQRDLRDDAGGVHVAVEDLAVEAERDDALLDPRAAALVDADDRAAGLHREVEDLDDLLAVDLAEAAAEDGHVLAEHADRPAVDGAVAGDHAVAVRAGCFSMPEVGRAVPGELVESRRTSPRRAAPRSARGRSSCPWRAASRRPGPSRRARPRRSAAAGRPACRRWCGCRGAASTSGSAPTSASCFLLRLSGSGRTPRAGTASSLDRPRRGHGKDRPGGRSVPRRFRSGDLALLSALTCRCRGVSVRRTLLCCQR